MWDYYLRFSNDHVVWRHTMFSRIKEKTLRRSNWSKFIWFQVTFGKSYTAFDKVFNTKEEAQEWIRQVESTLPSINHLHRAIF